MSWLTVLLIAAGAVFILFLVIMIVAQVRNSRNIESLKKEVGTQVKPAKPTEKPRTAEAAVPSEAKRPEGTGTSDAGAAVEEPKPEAPAETAKPVPEPIVPETVMEAPHVEPEIAEPEVTEPETVELEKEAVFEPKAYPVFSNARAVEQLGLSQEEADMFISELVTQIETELSNIDAAFEENDREKLERLSHMLKGSATSLGEGGVADVLVELNTYCKTGSDREIIRDHIHNLNYYFEQLKAQYAA